MLHDYGKWGTMHQRFIRWQRKGICKKLFELFQGNQKFEYCRDRFNLCKRLLAFVWYSRMESSYIKNERGVNSKIHLMVNEYGMQINFIVMDRSPANCKEAIHSIKNINAKLVFLDRAYGTTEILFYLNQRNISSVIPPTPKRNRLHQRGYKGFKEKRQ